jgi:hypothetical protein
MHLRWRLKKDASRLAMYLLLISVGMVVIGHLHFSFFTVCVEANRMSAGRSWKSRHFVVGICMDLVGCRYLKSRIVESSSLSQVCAFAFRIY